MKKYLVFAILLFTVMFFNSCSQGEHPPGHEHHEANADEYTASGYLKDGIRIIEVRASRYKFEPDPIVVNYMDKVRLVAGTSDVAHGIAIPAFKVDLSMPPGKKSETEFVADRRGTFHTHCSIYCGPGHGHMHGNLIVK